MVDSAWVTYAATAQRHDEGKQPEKHPDDEACGKLWEVYAAEAQRYDEGLVKSWKEDMDVTLVFSGLYSAVLTAFVIESYQNLQENPAETSATLYHEERQGLEGKINIPTFRL